MIGTITPVVYRDRRKAKWLVAIALYGTGATLSALMFGALLGWIGAGSKTAVATPAGWLLLAGLAFAYGLHELSLVRLPRPQRKWQVPASLRVHHHPWSVAFLYGSMLGPGFLVYIPVATFYLVVLTALAVAEPAASAAIFAAYGASQTLALLIAGWRVQTADDAYAVGVKTVGYRSLVHKVNGAALVSSAVIIATAAAL